MKLKRLIFTAGEKVLLLGVTLFYCAKDPATPTRVKAMIMGDLVYLISPIDVVPDPLPVVGFGDDYALLLATAAVVAAHVKKEHRERARETVGGWLAPLARHR